MGVLMECHAMCCSVSRLHEWGLVDEALQYVVACCSVSRHHVLDLSMELECVAVFQRCMMVACQ
jgi:hypothetical protein